MNIEKSRSVATRKTTVKKNIARLYLLDTDNTMTKFCQVYRWLLKNSEMLMEKDERACELLEGTMRCFDHDIDYPYYTPYSDIHEMKMVYTILSGGEMFMEWDEVESEGFKDYHAFIKNMHILAGKTKRYWGRRVLSNKHIERFVEINLSSFIKSLNDYITVGNEDEHEYDKITREYAKVFDEKLNIPDATLEYMKGSRFIGDKFGYVEIDANVDLEEFKTVEGQWEELKGYLPTIKQPLELRFRKLGRHHATGLYSNNKKAIAIDFRKLGAFVHEYAHAVDYNTESKCLSDLEEFSGIIELYRKNAYAREKEFPATSGKYGISYYTNKREIFARAFEVAFVGKYGVFNGLTKQENEMEGVEYRIFQDDKTLKNMVKEYFEQYI